MFKLGVASISFRNHTPNEIIKEATKSKLDAIEWGSDIHAPCNNKNALKEIVSRSSENGIAISSYGSYYRIGKDKAEEIVPYLEAAKILGTDTVRIWCGEKGSCETDQNEFSAMVEQGNLICEKAKEFNIKLCLECHQWTLTDNYSTALNYINLVASDNLKMYWQPNQFKSFDYNIASAKALLCCTENLHVFNWDSKNRYPLIEAKEVWKDYFEIFKGKSRFALLEFMHDDRLETLSKTASELRKICEEI